MRIMGVYSKFLRICDTDVLKYRVLAQKSINDMN